MSLLDGSPTEGGLTTKGFVTVEFLNGKTQTFLLPDNGNFLPVSHFLCVVHHGELHYINCDQIVSFKVPK